MNGFVIARRVLMSSNGHAFDKCTVSGGSSASSSLKCFLNTCDAGPGASPEGNRPFLDVLDLETKQTQRLWQSSPPYLEDTGSLLCDQHDQTIKQVHLCIVLC